MQFRNLSFLISLCWAGTLWAQEAPQNYQVAPLEELLVKEKSSIEDFLQMEVQTTDRTRTQKSSRAPATIVIVTEEQILRRNYQSLLDLLQDQPDIKIDFGVDPRWMHDVSIRGIRGMDKFVILMDGIRISSPTNDVIPVMQNFPVHMAKQVEIVYGPASALYGADAFAGVINIITKEASEFERTSITFQGSMYQSYLLNFFTGARLGEKTRLSISGQYHFDRQPDLQRFYPDDFTGLQESLQTGTFNSIFGPIRPNSVVFPEASTSPLSSYALTAQLQTGNFDFSFFRNSAQNPSTQAVNPNNSVYNEGAFFRHQISVLSARYNKTWEKIKSTSFLIGSLYELDPKSNFRNVYTSFEPAYLYSYGLMLKGEQLFNYEAIPERLSFTAGATYEYFRSYPRGHDLQNPIFSRNPSGKAIIVNSIFPLNPAGIEADVPLVEYSNVGALLQMQWQAFEQLSATVGARYDYNSRFGGAFNPRLGLVWEPSKRITIKGLYGSAFLAPSPLAAFDQFGTFFSTDNGATYRSFFFRLPNPDLKPQLINTIELGATVLLNKRLSLGLSSFLSRISGLFQFVSDSETLNLYNNTYKGWPVDFIEITVNQGAQRNYGGSLRLDYYLPLRKRGSLNAYLMLSYVDGRVNLEDGSSSEAEIPAYTPWMLRSGVDLSIGAWSFSPRLLWTGVQKTFSTQENNPSRRQEIAGFALLNISASYAFPSYFTLFADVQNALDQRYYHVNLGAAPQADISGAAAAAEFARGMPQYPLRLSAGARVRF